MWEIMVPTLRNDRPVRTKHHRVWDEYVRRLTGGLTIYRPAKGQWVDPASKQLFDERMIPVRIACTEAQIRQILAFTNKHYCQKAAMAYKVSEQVLILNADGTEQQTGESIEPTTN